MNRIKPLDTHVTLAIVSTNFAVSDSVNGLHVTLTINSDSLGLDGAGIESR